MMPARFAALVALSLTFLGGRPALGADDLARLLPADTTGLGYFNFQHLGQAELFKKYVAGPLMKQEDFRKFLQGPGLRFVKKTGLNPLTDIEMMVSANVPSTEKNIRLFAVFIGNFDPEKLTAAAAEFVAAHKEPIQPDLKGIMFFRLQMNTLREKKRTFIVFKIAVKWSGLMGGKSSALTEYKLDLYATVVDRHRVLLGTRDDVMAALDRVDRKAEPVIRKKSLLRALDRLQPTSVYGMIDFNLKGLPNLEDPILAKLIQKVTGNQLDLRVGADIGLFLRLEMSDVDAAKEIKLKAEKLVDQVKASLDQLILLAPKAGPLLGDVKKNFSVKRKGKIVTVQTALTGKVIDAFARSMSGK